MKAYPALSRRYGEVSCIAGLNMETKEWMRLYPVPFRSLEDRQKFKKYQPIKVRVQRPRGDRRPESWRVAAESIEVLGPPLSSAKGWKDRQRIVEPAMSTSMCAVRVAQRENGTSLAMFRPKEVLDLVIQDVEVDPSKDEMSKALASQRSLLEDLNDAEITRQRRALEQIPFRFQYHYFCSTEECAGHTQSIVDWEVAALYRNVRHRHNWRELVRAQWLEQMCGPDKETAFIVGDQHQHPGSFLVLGVWWPPKLGPPDSQLSLGDLGDL